MKTNTGEKIYQANSSRSINLNLGSLATSFQDKLTAINAYIQVMLASKLAEGLEKGVRSRN